jgi:hypothetical protein
VVAGERRGKDDRQQNTSAPLRSSFSCGHMGGGGGRVNGQPLARIADSNTEALLSSNKVVPGFLSIYRNYLQYI